MAATSDGRDEIYYYQVPRAQFEEQMGEEYAVMYRWFNGVGYEVDIAALRREYPELTTFERYLGHGWEVRSFLPRIEPNGNYLLDASTLRLITLRQVDNCRSEPLRP